jgi:hypothetical protein
VRYHASLRLHSILAFIGVLPATGAGVELHVQYSAIQKVLAQQMFGEEGRLWVHGNAKSRCSFAFLENPRLGGIDGRLRIQARFSGRNAANLFGFCLGPGDAFDLDIMATPYFQEGAIRLKDIYVESGGRETYYSRKVREAIRDNLPKKFEYRVSDEARKIMEREPANRPYQQELKNFQVSQVRVTPAAVILNLDFTLVVK